MKENQGVISDTIIVDRQTGVMYLFHGSGYKGGLSVMFDHDGKPLIYTD